ncbi:hypothetical protein JCM10213_001942 [Rhodosporidiobolus nylandii]
MRTPSPAPSTASDDGAAARLAQLEALLAGQLFAAEPHSPSVGSPSEGEADRPAKRRKEEHDATDDAGASGATAGEGGNSEPVQEEQVAFRLFSTHKAPQKVVIREKEQEHPVVRDRRIRAVEDEPAEAVRDRAEAIERLAVDGSSILAGASLPPPDASTHSRLCTTRLARFSAHPPPLAYLNARLPPPLAALSPFSAPSSSPPEHPHEGLLACPPFEDFYAKHGEDVKQAAAGRKTAAKGAASTAAASAPGEAAGMSKSAKKRAAAKAAAAAASGAAPPAAGVPQASAKPALPTLPPSKTDWAALPPLPKQRTRGKDPRPRLPPRNKLLRYEAEQTGSAGLRLMVVKIASAKGGKGTTRKGKSARERERRRKAAVATTE